MHPWQPYPILLASGSPRRRALLTEAGFEFRVVVTNVNETLPPHIQSEEAAVYLAAWKARAALPLAQPQEIILAADSVVILDDRILDKPANREEAIQHLQALSGRTHLVMTGICLQYQRQQWTRAARTEVTFASLTPDEITWYVDQCNPYDKAGGYGIQEWIGLCRVDRINGTYANVMGLPVHLVYDGLQQFRLWSQTDQG
ncbi:MAG: septum formation protein Maf [Lewinellaceae bacterium]|nr:septum formation protein Maf [Lewinellaceae bacterium]